MAGGVLPPEISIVYSLWIQLFPDQSPKYFLKLCINFPLKLLSVLSKQLAQPLN